MNAIDNVECSAIEKSVIEKDDLAPVSKVQENTQCVIAFAATAKNAGSLSEGKIPLTKKG